MNHFIWFVVLVIILIYHGRVLSKSLSISFTSRWLVNINEIVTVIRNLPFFGLRTQKVKRDSHRTKTH